MFSGRRVVLPVLVASVLGVGTGGAPAAGWLAPQSVPLAVSDLGFDGAGNAVVVGIGADSRGDPTIRAITRPPGGQWTASVPVSGAGDSDLWSPHVAVNPQGDAVAIWSAVDDVSSQRIVWVASRTSGGAWGEPVALSSDAVYFHDHQVAIDNQGNATAIWTEFDGGSAFVVRGATRSSGGTWSAPVDVSARADGTATTTALAVNPAGDAVAAWIRSDGQVVQAAYRAAGGAWGAPVALSGRGLSSAPRVVVDPSGNATAVWEWSQSGIDLVQTARRIAGGGWGATVDLASGGSPRVAVDPQGRVIAIWTAPGPSVRSSSFTGGGPWSASVELAASSGAGRVGTPWVGVDPQGREIAIWARISGGDVTAQASHRVAEGGWSAAVDLSVSPIGALPAAGVDPSGHATLVWSPSGFSSTGPWSGFSSVFDDVAPELRGLRVPAEGIVGQPVGMSVDPFDVWSTVTTSWDFGDGASASGASPSHTYASPGERTVTITGIDSAGNTTQTSRTITIDPVPIPGPGGPSPGPSGPIPGPGPIAAPVVSNLTQSSSRWRVRAVKRQPRLPVGTTFRFRLNRAASVRLSFSRILSGRRAGGRCVKPTRANRSKPRCSRYQSRGALTMAGRAGSNAYTFRGRIRGRTLKPGRYRLRVTALADGKTSAAVSIRFTIAR